MRPAIAAAALALSTLLITGCGAIGNPPSPTSTYTGSDGTVVTVNWADYPGEAGMDSAEVMAAPDQDEIEPRVRELIERLSAAVEDEAGLDLRATGPESTWFDDENWYTSGGNGYGGESMYVTLNCCDQQSDAAPSRDRWAGILAAASAVTEEYGLGPLILEQDSAAMRADPTWLDEYAQRYCSDPAGECWAWFATAYGDSQWVSFGIQDAALDTSGAAAEEAERLDWPPASISFSYGATVIRSGARAEFERAHAPFAGLDKPAQTTSD